MAVTRPTKSESYESPVSPMSIIPKKWIIIGIGIVLLVAILFFTFKFERINGNEIGVRENISSGVSETVIEPSGFFYNSMTDTYYHYDLSSKVFAMNNVGKVPDAYLVQSSDQQDMHISLNIRWRVDKAKVVSIHKSFNAHVGNDEENKLEKLLIRPNVQRIVKNHATKMKAMEAYSGDGLVKLQTEIEADLMNASGELRTSGIIVENFVIEMIALDPNYTAEIKARQIAQQKKLRADEETKAADADALKAKAVAQADLNKAVVEAERDKQVAVLKAEQEAQAQVKAAQANKERTVLAAQAEAEQITVRAKAEREAAALQAASIEMLGKANADAQKLKFSAYSAPGAEVFAQIEIAKSLGQSLSGIQGYLPQDMKVNLLTDNFMNSVRSLMNPKPTTPAAK